MRRTQWKTLTCGKPSCNHTWALFWPDEDGEPLQRQCEKCLQLEVEYESGLFLIP